MSEAALHDASRLKWILLALLAWSVLAAIPTSSAYIVEGSRGLQRWLWMFWKIVPYYYLWALATPAIYRLAVTRLNPRRGWLQAVLGHIALCFALSLFFGFLLHPVNWRAWLFGAIAPGYHTMSVFSYLFILLGIYFYVLRETVRRQDALIAAQRQRELELETGIARAQVEQLRGQMNPHFLFNALNCVGALIETGQNDRAYEVLEDLGSLLRSSLEHRDQELVPLSDELDFARRYVAMEQVRFGDRLRISFHVDDSTAAWLVPPFALQPLIENAVKHAVAPSRDAVTIEVNARRTAGGIALEVIDNGSGNDERPASGGTGVGFENLRKRLALIYGDDAGLKFIRDERGARAQLDIPDLKASVQRPEDAGERSTPDPSLAWQAAQLR